MLLTYKKSYMGSKMRDVVLLKGLYCDKWRKTS